MADGKRRREMWLHLAVTTEGDVLQTCENEKGKGRSTAARSQAGCIERGGVAAGVVCLAIYG